LDNDLLEELNSRVSNAICAAQNSQMKEIRGLGDRLSALEQYLMFVKQVLQEQVCDKILVGFRRFNRSSNLNLRVMIFALGYVSHTNC